MAANAGDLETCRWINQVLLIAGRLHINFYENDLHEDTVLSGLIQCEELAELLHHRFAAVGAAPGGVI